MAIQTKLLGAKELSRAMRGLPKTMQRKLLMQGLRAGAKIFQSAAKANVPVDSGALRRSIKVRVGKVRTKGDKSVVVITGKSMFEGKTFYGAFVEYGHGLGKRSRGVALAQERRSRSGQAGDGSAVAGDTRKRVPARPFMRPAFDTAKATASYVALKHIQVAVERAAENGGVG